MQEFQVRTTVLPDGERLAILTGRDGLPVFSPNVYAISQLRGRNLAFATISNSLRALIVLEQFLGSHGSGIDLRSRIAAGQLLSVAEIDALAIACRLPMNHFHGASELASYRRASATTQFESHRNRAPTSRDSLISPQAAATRLQSIRGYLVWLVGVRCTDSTTSPEVRESLLATSKFTFDAISARLPRGRYRSWGKEREGLDDGPAATLLDLINPEADDNPWTNPHVRIRNSLIIQWLYYLGLRRGELLSVRISDIDFGKEKVSIVRRPDDVSDPRRNQPCVKTRAHEAPIAPSLLQATRSYIIEYRSKIRPARKHDFLFVAESGAPLSIASFSKIFNVLRAKHTQIPRNLSGHVLRHTWNDRFSVEMDRHNVPEDIERKNRAYLMGWSPTSEMAVNYTRRHIRKKAREASLQMQKRLTRGATADE